MNLNVRYSCSIIDVNIMQQGVIFFINTNGRVHKRNAERCCLGSVTFSQFSVDWMAVTFQWSFNANQSLSSRIYNIHFFIYGTDPICFYPPLKDSVSGHVQYNCEIKVFTVLS